MGKGKITTNRNVPENLQTNVIVRKLSDIKVGLKK